MYVHAHYEQTLQRSAVDRKWVGCEMCTPQSFANCEQNKIKKEKRIVKVLSMKNRIQIFKKKTKNRNLSDLGFYVS